MTTEEDGTIRCHYDNCQKTVTSQRGLSLHIAGAHNTDKPWKDESTLREMYLDEKMTTAEIGEELGCNPSTVGSSLEDFGIKRRGSFKNDGVYEKPWRDKETFLELYTDESLTMGDIAEEWGCDKSVIFYWLEGHDIPESQRRAPEWDASDYEYDYTDADDLEYLYHERDLALREMEEYVGRSPRTIRTWMMKHGIEREDKNDKGRSPIAPFYHDDRGYEGWVAAGFGNRGHLRVHRLLAIAEGADPHQIFSGDYHVHHKNGIRWDNRPDNIEVMLQSEHARIHLKERWNDSEFRERMTGISRELAKKRPQREEGGFGKGFVDE